MQMMNSFKYHADFSWEQFAWELGHNFFTETNEWFEIPMTLLED